MLLIQIVIDQCTEEVCIDTTKYGIYIYIENYQNGNLFHILPIISGSISPVIAKAMVFIFAELVS